VEVDLGPDELASVRKGRGAWVTIGILLLAAGGAAAWYRDPTLFGLLRPKRPPAEPAVAAAAAVPLTIEVKPEQAPAEPAAPAAAPLPVAAPEPVAEPSVAPPPEPIVKPAAAPAAKPAPKGPRALFAEAARLREHGKAERALDLYGRVVDLQPENVDALTGRGLCYLDLERYAPAEASFQAALGITPDAAGALLGLAETYRWQGKNADAIRYYETYLAKHPEGDEADVARNALEQLRR
jgi:hypothetical protein